MFTLYFISKKKRKKRWKIKYEEVCKECVSTWLLWRNAN